jgi:hypothetical protein
MIRNPIFRSAFASVVFAVSLSACAARQPIETQAALGKVVVYRNGVAYFERRAVVTDGQLKLTVPVDRVDDFLKSLKVIDAQTKQSLPVSFDTLQPSRDEAEMIVSVPEGSRELLVSYVTDSPAWKPSYRIVLDGKKDSAELEAWAVVDNVSGEDWNRVTIGVGSTSALSFRYDLHSVREVQRETLGDEAAYAMAGPMGGSPYAVAANEAPVVAALDNSMFDRLTDGRDEEVREEMYGTQATAAEADEMLAGAMDARSSGGGSSALRTRAGKGKSAERRGRQPSAPASAPPSDEATLQQLAAQINQRPGKVQIQGFARRADADPQGAALSRANTLRDQLMRHGVAADKIDAQASGLVSESQAVRVITDGAEGKPQQSAAPEDLGATIGNAYFVSKVPMTIEKDRSAMVSLLKQTAKAERVYYYDAISPRGSKTFAFQAVRMDNPSDQTLDRGPFTVYAQGQFLGEGLSDAIPPHSTAFVPYALDRQVVVDTKTETSEEVNQLLAIERGVVHAEVHQINETTFALHNRGTEPAKVYVRYAVAPGFELRAGNHKVERLGNDYLLPIEVPAHKTAELRVAQARPDERAIDMRASSGAASVEAYLKRTKTLPPELRAQLDSIVALYREMASIEEKHTTLAEQMNEYRVRVDEINVQLVTLRKVRTASALSAHLAKKMKEISDRLQKATIRSTDLQEELMACRIRMQDQLADLKLAREAKDQAIAAK